MKKSIFKKIVVLTYLIFLLIGFLIPVHFSSAFACTTAPICQPPSVLASDGCSCTYVLLAPLPCGNGSPGCKTTTFDPTNSDGQNSKLGEYLNMMLRLFIGICAVLAVIMIVVGGIEYMTTELISSKEAGKERIRNAIFGLLLALGAWTLLYTINPDLLKTDLRSLTAVEVQVVLNDDVPQTPINGRYSNGAADGAVWAPTQGWPALNAMITTNHPGVDCATVGQRNCTSLQGLNPSIVNTTQSNCACQLTITAGTEFWLHGTGTSHGPGNSTVDLSATSDLNKYITGNGTFPNTSTVTSKNGTCYLAEHPGQTSQTTAQHWHVYSC